MNRFQYHYLFLPDVVPRTGAVLTPSCPADHLLHSQEGGGDQVEEGKAKKPHLLQDRDVDLNALIICGGPLGD